ncbi:MAG: hypothetical protein GXX91_03920 [Verrucomicrobiaceae bacterium]|nr:hypothetical protein [Verrucomicrobiaceae bacterium]
MFRTAHSGAFLILLAFLISGAVAQESSDFHRFTDKKGQQISAVLLDVSADRQQMKIRREDGQVFETVINLLCLDDQQYIKDWLKKPAETAIATNGTSESDAPAALGADSETAAAAPADFRLDVALSRHNAAVEKHASRNVSLEGRATTFRITVRNLSRDSLEAARLAYAVVWEDRATLYQTGAGEWTFRAAPDGEGSSRRVKHADEIELGSLRFNGETTVETSPVTMEQVVFLGDNKPYREDEILGVKVRILSQDGQVLHESDSGGAAIASMKWGDIESLPVAMSAD